MPPERAVTILGFIENLVRSGIAERSLPKGAQAPDFVLPNAKGKMVKFSDLRAQGPVVVAFYRGAW